MTPNASQQVCWFEVYAFVSERLAGIASWPTAGTTAWAAMPDDDPRKLAAILEAGVHWALRIDAEQEALAQAQLDVSSAADWSAIASSNRRHADALRSGAYISMRRSA